VAIENIEKVSKMTPKIHAHSCTLSKFREGHFRGFRDFQLRIEVKFRKGVFDVFGKIFTFAFYRLEVDIILWGENLNFAFFEKCGTRFRFWVRFCAALLEKIRPDENDDAYRLPYRPCCAGGQFSYAFVQIGCEMASKKKKVLQYYYIGYESRESRCNTDYRFRKRVFLDSKLKCF
jgi:hypothetical protein